MDLYSLINDHYLIFIQYIYYKLIILDCLYFLRILYHVYYTMINNIKTTIKKFICKFLLLLLLFSQIIRFYNINYNFILVGMIFFTYILLTLIIFVYFLSKYNKIFNKLYIKLIIN